jgi:hypothetical protein
MKKKQDEVQKTISMSVEKQFCDVFPKKAVPLQHGVYFMINKLSK